MGAWRKGGLFRLSALRGGENPTLLGGAFGTDSAARTGGPPERITLFNILE
jgi:hypothetical protein